MADSKSTAPAAAQSSDPISIPVKLRGYLDDQQERARELWVLLEMAYRDVDGDNVALRIAVRMAKELNEALDSVTVAALLGMEAAELEAPAAEPEASQAEPAAVDSPAPASTGPLDRISVHRCELEHFADSVGRLESLLHIIGGQLAGDEGDAIEVAESHASHLCTEIRELFAPEES